jgi:diguanylate cyclase (GGDEF)-like protein/PAS domain S-box-containing protein
VRCNFATWIADGWIRWTKRHRLALRLAGCFVFIALATVYIRRAPYANHLIWLANGVMLAYLLVVPRKHWPAFLMAGFAGQACGSLLAAVDGQTSVFLTLLNLTEVYISAFLLRRRSIFLPSFTNSSYLLRFMIYGAFAGPVAAGAIYAALASLHFYAPPGFTMLQWMGADGLGACVATPACVAIFRAHFKRTQDFRRSWGYLVLFGAFAFASFCQTRAPLLFISLALLLLVLLRLGMGWASIGALFLAGVGSWYTLRDQGPFAASNSLTPLEPSISLQAFLASGMLMLYSVSVVLESHRAIQRRLGKIAALHALVTENSTDAIIVSDLRGNRRYVSPASEKVCGLKPEEVMRQNIFELVHPHDMAQAKAVARKVQQGHEDAGIECRIRNREGKYVWVEASLRVVWNQETGAPSGVLNLVRDISQRKEAEEQLKEAYRALESLAITDPLTGLANRRHLDQCLEREWRRGMRERQPLSMLLIDADYFKSYNDEYGHLRGDGCLKQIAESALDVVFRPGDLVARFGGEEFAVILPGTQNEGAMQIATQICAALANRKLKHSANPFGFVTVSIGCATLVPKLGQNAIQLIERADQALYHAKNNGRNHACNGNGTCQKQGADRAMDRTVA